MVLDSNTHTDSENFKYQFNSWKKVMELFLFLYMITAAKLLYVQRFATTTLEEWLVKMIELAELVILPSLIKGNIYIYLSRNHFHKTEKSELVIYNFD